VEHLKVCGWELRTGKRAVAPGAPGTSRSGEPG
jgi:hypothetical protein